MIAALAAVVSIVSVAVAVLQTRRANLIAGRSSTAAERAARASERQTTIQDQLRRSTAEPYVWVDIRPDEQSGQIMLLLVGNSGPTVATNVVVKFDPPLGETPLPNDAAALGEQRLGRGLASLPPGRVLTWSLGVSFELLMADGLPLHYSVTVAATGPFGPLEPLSYEIDLDDIRHNRVTAPGTLHGVTRALSELGKDLKGIRQHTGNINKAAQRVAPEPPWQEED